VKLHDLKPAPGSSSDRKRVGRGTGGKGGKTAGRGTKGQGARNNIKPGFEGGQMPLQRRIPKMRGFKNPFRVEYQAVNLDTLTTVTEQYDLTEVTPDVLHAHGLTHKGALVKVLGRGEISRALTVKAHGFSKAAEAAITAAGGTVEVLPPPFGHGRPPARGNALTNR
jgi:large subunit ribosomal protein L15